MKVMLEPVCLEWSLQHPRCCPQNGSGLFSNNPPPTNSKTQTVQDRAACPAGTLVVEAGFRRSSGALRSESQHERKPSVKQLMGVCVTNKMGTRQGRFFFGCPLKQPPKGSPQDGPSLGLFGRETKRNPLAVLGPSNWGKHVGSLLGNPLLISGCGMLILVEFVDCMLMNNWHRASYWVCTILWQEGSPRM